ncbi:MAG: thiamine pyrophosphate-dependent enzyme [Thermoanaerobaculia bacterium]
MRRIPATEARVGRREALELTDESIVRDYRLAYRSRQASLLGRREALTGKAKFGIFGDGKEVAQVAMARAFRPGDVRSGYYRDQTLMMALERLTVQQFFAQLYADPDGGRDPHSGGRQMNAHFATRMLDEQGRFLDLTAEPHTAADLSPLAAQMPKLVGLGYASRLYRELPELAGFTGFSRRGDEIAWGTIGNASCAEGLFWETLNAVGVLHAPVVISIWDDGYGISVPNEYQIAKPSLYELLQGFQRAEGGRDGVDIYRVAGWDYPSLTETYRSVAETVRREHVPAVVHVAEMTQPQGHSTSGSHERYKSPERLAWEEEYDCIARMRQWMVEEGIANAATLDALEEEERQQVRKWQQEAWDAFRAPFESDRRTCVELLRGLEETSAGGPAVREVRERVEKLQMALRRDLYAAAHEALLAVTGESSEAARALTAWRREQDEANDRRYDTHLLSDSEESPLRVAVVPARYVEDSPVVRGFEVLNACFDAALARYPNFIAFGEDVGKLGDVNQGFQGMQEKYGELRVSDTGIREATILGQAIGMAMRGLRPLAEMQYLDYALYCLQVLSDDLASLRYRSAGSQKAPVIVRTRGHRLEGIWHSGSEMAGILNLIRGVHFCVPRDMTQAAGMYNTLLRGDDPGFVVEVLNGYRLKERLPDNIGEFTVPLGVPEVLREGTDVTIVTYGACCRIALDAAALLAETVGVDCEVVDVQTLLPFDREARVVDSLKKTNRVLFLDEDMPGGASAFMMQRVLDRDGGWQWLDARPRALAAKPHRPAYGSDGDYFSKPNREQVVDAVLTLMHETDPRRYRPLI